MKLTVVGYWHGFPESKEATSGYLLEADGFRLLLDCGSGVISNLQRYTELNQLDAVVLSHYHHDHAADVKVLHYHRILRHYGEGQERPLTIYGHNEDRESFAALGYEGFVDHFPIDDTKPFTIGPFTFTFVKTDHPVPCYGMKVEHETGSFFYTADSSYIEKLAEAGQDVDLFICECSLYAGTDGSHIGHMNSTEAGKLAEKANANELLLTHLPHTGDHGQLRTEAAEEFTGPVHVARRGWTRKWN
ncbi:MBL fold metallo-hydrolase [Salsuginibacillus kocurii]|uniref:MBL fold metallo-hydrolase n=1 Tax=Salsuginibacillus kocurii TaxID=427078 RepID=UPI00036BD253|nr:MBL fold metallo-hydrolase [Salsuginibacillus kocurii]